MSQPLPCILFTAFEPSGDEHAAPVIAELRKQLPDVPVYALGGERMHNAGATLIESTVQDAAMLGGAMAKVGQQMAIRRRMRAWLAMNPTAIHVPTDSPAANWGLCRLVKRQPPQDKRIRGGSRVVHLVCPQVWAWATWRVRRLRKWSDHVLCILPFEPKWLAKRGVRGTFIGHPLFDEPLDLAAMESQAVSLPTHRPRIALLPGSRPGEVRANWPILRQVANRLSSEFPVASFVIAAANETAAHIIEKGEDPKPDSMALALGMTEAVLHWADVVLTVSGTATLHVARHRKPMVIVYRVSPLQWHLLGKWLISTRTFTLPNLIACNGPSRSDAAHIVREFVPWLSDAEKVEPIVAEAERLLTDEVARDRQVAALEAGMRKFLEHRAGNEAANVVAEMYQQCVPDYAPPRQIAGEAPRWRRFANANESDG